MRFFSRALFVAVIALCGWSLWSFNDSFRGKISSYVENGEFLTWEARFTPDQIMEEHRDFLISDNEHSFQQPKLKFYPYLFMEVKFTDDNKQTKEGIVLWSLTDGEMVINTRDWEMTHGFEDALLGGATRSDFLVIQALAKNQGTLSRDQFHAILGVEAPEADTWISQAHKKKFIVGEEEYFHLHFQNPNFLVAPHTKINQWLVTKPYNHVQRVPRRFSRSQVEAIATSAFGDTFTIRDSREVFLPVYSIEVLNPDGSVLTTYWNALNGERLDNQHVTLAG